VTIIRPHHPLRGQQFDVLREGKELTLRLHDGTSMRILRQWTDADVDGAVHRSAAVAEGIYTTEALRRLFALVDALKSR
jgi:hypothetical protein